jgi:hypothetical protein
MATRYRAQIAETPTEARQAEPGPSVLVMLVASTALVVLVLGFCLVHFLSWLTPECVRAQSYEFR